MAEHKDGFPLRTYTKQIDAVCYNQARLALNRLGSPLRLALPRHRALEVIVRRDIWLCVDGARDDLPVLAWFDFKTRGRVDLHAPVPCRLELYHIHAGLVMGTALDALTEALKRCLATARLPPSQPH